MEEAEVAAALGEASIARRCWNVLGGVRRCFPVGEAEEFGVERAKRVARRSSGDSPELRKTTTCEALEARERLCRRPGMIGDRSGVCGWLWIALEVEELANEVGVGVG